MFLTLFFGVFLVAAGALAYYFLTKKGIKQVPIHNHDWKPDIVYLYQFPRSASMPNVSPFCLKVETFLKANKIPYEVRPLLMGRSQYGLLPFIELNGEHIADSQIIIHRLTEHFKTKTLLIPRDEAIARTIDRMTDNHTFLLLCQFKVLSSGTNDFFSMTLSEAGAPKLFIPILAYLFRRKAANRVTGSLGHFSTEDFKMFLKKDYDAYRDLLGDQKFLFGDEINAVELRKHDWKSDTVYLYQFPRSKTIPNLSPYCLKVETFLKVNKIPYEVCPLIMGRSRYGLLPFIELNGEHIADSSVIIDRLKEHFKVKPLASPRDEGIVRAIERTVENHTAHVVYRFKVVEDPNNGFCEAVLRDVGCPAVLLPIMLPLAAWCMRLKVSRRIGAAIGQFPVEDFKKFLQKDFDTYRDLLGDKKFLFGDEISSADCAVFSHLATVLYIPLNNYVKELLREKYPELTNYCDRVRDTVFGKDFAEE